MTPLILNIDTSSELAQICFSKGNEIIAKEQSSDQKNHASFLEPAIKKLVQNIDIELQDIDAVAVINGPGSYTGLRVALASAKALCYTLNKPLIVVNTLQVLTFAAINKFKESYSEQFFCPMIDARRMEVFTALYTEDLKNILPPSALILDEYSFSEVLVKNKIIFFGSGSKKFQNILQHPNAFFTEVNYTLKDLVYFSNKFYSEKVFANIFNAAPFYLKEFFFTSK